MKEEEEISDYPDDDEPNNPQTKLNAQLATLFEIRDKLNECNIHSENSVGTQLNIEELLRWKYKLYSVYREVKTLVSPEDYASVENKKTELNKLPRVLTTTNRDGEISPHINKRAFFQHWNKINEIDEEIRKLLHLKGMLVTFKDDDLAAGEYL